MTHAPGLIYRICGVQVTQREHYALDLIRAQGVCLYCGRTGLSNRYGNARRHSLACGRGRTLLQIEKCLAARLVYEKALDSAPAIAKATNTQQGGSNE